MRRVGNLWACLLLVVSACSLVVDFPPNRETADAGRDAQVPRDGGRDASRVDAGGRDAAPPATGCELTSNARCQDDQLCCDRMDGNGPSCIDTAGASDCTACGAACSDAKAPNCGARTCECEAGSGKACSGDQRCVGEGAEARCVQCMVDADCSSRGDNLKQCVNSKCVECDRGPLANNSVDDEGCAPTTPICNTNNACTGCSVEDMNCPTGMQCNPGLGCSGCRLSVPISENGCGGTSPVCGTITIDGKDVQQCRKCTADSECSGGYCLNRTGECVNGCDPDELPGANACAPVTPICKAGVDGFACTICSVQADCAGLVATPLCATAAGTLRGQCVQCRTNTDCVGNATGPVCGLQGSCRARTEEDCQNLTPRQHLSATGTCVQCRDPGAASADCAGNAGGPYCTNKNTCGQCVTDAQCLGMSGTPVCSPMTNECVAGCTSNTQCAAPTPLCAMGNGGGVCVGCRASSECPAATPICSDTTRMCVACTTDQSCNEKNPSLPICARAPGATQGQCVGCERRGNMQAGCVNNGTNKFCDSTISVCAACDDASEAGCNMGRQCTRLPAAGSALACFPCDPAKPGTESGCPAGTTCTNYACVVVPDAGT